MNHGWIIGLLTLAGKTMEAKLRLWLRLNGRNKTEFIAEEYININKLLTNIT